MNVVTENVDVLELSPRVIKLYGDVDDDMVKQFHKDFQKVLQTQQTICPIVIHSEGGNVWDAMHIVHALRDAPVEIATIVAGAAYSAGALIFTCGAEGQRYMGKHACLMLHDIRIEGMDGKCTDIQNEAREMKRNNDMLFSVMSRNTGHRKRYFRELVRSAEHVDVYLSAKEALAHNLCNHIGVPSLVHRIQHSLQLRCFHKKRKRVEISASDDEE